TPHNTSLTTSTIANSYLYLYCYQLIPFSRHYSYLIIFFFNDTATTEIYTLSLHDALPIFPDPARLERHVEVNADENALVLEIERSEEHTSELQSRGHLVCRLLLEKKKTRQHEVVLLGLVIHEGRILASIRPRRVFGVEGTL